ncbi:hypothetical protein QBC35DRAFT_100431 [Podospora australis]|uniref:Uncharacterized protein n=1 Tax=Podospora australis TaxID=1536484 RepID=A0AAN6X4K2_9PEZI|nr:hypothetical protein QBC35DRAFT_100431 [Podospora australis]
MAARPGEDNVATLFADVHYFYGPPTDKPPHHRFDKDSYVYLFEDADQRRARLEIANQPGTDDQDAFDGYLDNVQLQYSYNHTCLVTIIVGRVDGQEEWHLPTYDPHNQNKYHYKLFSLDIYFRSHKDALEFVNGIRRVLPPHQCEVLDEPAPPPRHPADASALVQQLERAAISDSQPSGGAPSFAPPPVSAVSGDGTDLPPPPPPPAAFSPIAYNPAAPPAPEQLRHREKTPPPEDGVANPLIQTLVYDAQTPFSPGLAPGHSGLGPLSPGIPPPQFQHPPGAPSFPGPPVASPGFAPSGFGVLSGHPSGLSQHPGAPVHPGIVRAATMPASPGLPHVGSPYNLAAVPGVYNPGGVVGVTHTPTPPNAGGIGNVPAPSSSVPPQPAGPAGASEYSVHQQFYVPEGQYKPKQETAGKFEQNAGRIEKGVTGMLKRFEKKFG